MEKSNDGGGCGVPLLLTVAIVVILFCSNATMSHFGLFEMDINIGEALLWITGGSVILCIIIEIILETVRYFVVRKTGPKSTKKKNK